MSGLLLFILDRDERALLYLITRRHSLVDPVMRYATHLGDAVVTMAIVLALLASGAPTMVAAGWNAGFALVASHALVQLLKRTISRPRPQLPLGVALAAAPDRFSFPSGHAAASLSVVLGTAALIPAPLYIGALALAALVGLSRCYLGVHYPGDVLSGWLLAVAGFLAAGMLGL